MSFFSFSRAPGALNTENMVIGFINILWNSQTKELHFIGNKVSVNIETKVFFHSLIGYPLRRIWQPSNLREAILLLTTKSRCCSWKGEPEVRTERSTSKKSSSTLEKKITMWVLLFSFHSFIHWIQDTKVHVTPWNVFLFTGEVIVWRYFRNDIKKPSTIKASIVFAPSNCESDLRSCLKSCQPGLRKYLSLTCWCRTKTDKQSWRYQETMDNLLYHS